MTPGTFVRVTSRCSSNGRTGTVTKTSAFWADMGWHCVELTEIPFGIFPASELEVVEPQRPAQSSLFEVAR